MKVAICDDDKEYRYKLKRQIYSFFELLCIEGNVFEYDSGSKLLGDICHKNFDLIILDIVMVDEDGISIAREIRNMDKYVCIVFLTNYEKYAIKGYGLNIYRYLIKCEDESNIKDIIYELYLEKKENTIVLKMQKEIVNFDLNSIFFFEVNNRTITVHYEFSKEYRIKKFYGKLDEIEQQLKGEAFYRSHRSYIVNLRKIRKIVSREIFFDIDPKAIVSRSKYLELKEIYINYNVAI